MFRKEGVKVDVPFQDVDTGEEWWFCGEVERVHAVMIRIKFANGDPCINLKPKENEVRLCVHTPQLQTRFKL
jgi:hypothetical protein